MQRIAAGERQPLARHARIVQIGDDAVFQRRGKRLAGVEPPGAFVVAAGALVHAAGDKQRAAGAGAVDHVNRVILVIIHVRPAHQAILLAILPPGSAPNPHVLGCVYAPVCARWPKANWLRQSRLMNRLLHRLHGAFQPSCPLPRCFTRRFTSSCLPALNGRASGLPR